MRSPTDPGSFRTRNCPGCGATIGISDRLCTDCLEREVEARRGDDG
jgi:hypothetical protein